MTKSAEELADIYTRQEMAAGAGFGEVNDAIREAYTAGYIEGKKQGRESMLLEVQQLISARIASWRAAGWDKITNRELGEAIKIDELIDSLYEKEGKDE